MTALLASTVHWPAATIDYELSSTRTVKVKYSRLCKVEWKWCGYDSRFMLLVTEEVAT